MINLMLYAIVGGVIGVLINYLADVLPQTRRLSKPLCPNCQNSYSLRGYLISFKCPNCGAKPIPRTFFVLVGSVIIAVLMGIFPLQGLSFWLTLPALIFLGIILVIDIEHHVVLIETSLAGLILFFAYGWFLNGLLITAVGGVAGFVIMLLIYFFGILFSKGLGKIRKVEINETALGFGDVYASAFLGLFVGWPMVIFMILMAIILSGVYSFLYLVVKSIKKDYQSYTTIPYTPFLIMGAVATFYISQMMF